MRPCHSVSCLSFPGSLAGGMPCFLSPFFISPITHPLPDAGPSPPLFVRWLELATFLLSPCPHFLLPLFAGFLSTQAGFLSLVWSLAASAPLLFLSWMSLLEAPFSPSCPPLRPGVHLASVSVAWLLAAPSLLTPSWMPARRRLRALG